MLFLSLDSLLWTYLEWHASGINDRLSEHEHEHVKHNVKHPIRISLTLMHLIWHYLYKHDNLCLWGLIFVVMDTTMWF